MTPRPPLRPAARVRSPGLLLALAVLLAGCGKPEAPVTPAPPVTSPATWDLTPLGPLPPILGDRMTPDGVRVLTLQAGEGPAAVPGERIEVRVQGRLRDGSTFLTQVGAVDADVRDRARLIVPGFAPALEALKPGERRLVLIPHPLGYGARPPAPIVPRHADLVFDVTRLFVRVKDLVVGLGEEARAGDNVLVHYRGTLADGTVFDDSRVNNKGEPLTLPLRRPGSGRGGVIEGWLRGLPGMRVGGTRRLEIPAHLAYGEAGSPNGKVPPDADLTFVVELFGLPDEAAPAR